MITTNNNQNYNEICEVLSKLDCVEDVNSFVGELFTESEIQDIVQRWNILKMLNGKKSQRAISNALSVSLCKTTRGAKILKDDKSLIKQILANESWRK